LTSCRGRREASPAGFPTGKENPLPDDREKRKIYHGLLRRKGAAASAPGKKGYCPPSRGRQERGMYSPPREEGRACSSHRREKKREDSWLPPNRLSEIKKYPGRHSPLDGGERRGRKKGSFPSWATKSGLALGDLLGTHPKKKETFRKEEKEGRVRLIQRIKKKNQQQTGTIVACV